MNTRKHFYRILFSAGLLSALFTMCTKDPVTSIEVTNGDCSGRILRTDGTPAAGAAVMLIPGDYTPASSSGTVDTTFTDSNGRYSFGVAAPRIYNIIARQASASGLLDSIFLKPDSVAHLGDLTLAASGYLTGIITLKENNDPRNVVILIPGTDRYAAPDSNGVFRSPELPQGTFTIRIFTTDEGYSPVDTTATIVAGSETSLSVRLPSSDAPDIGGLTGELDSALMYLTLHWALPDTTGITSYRLTRHSPDGTDTSFLLEKSAASFTDDVLFFEDDTLSYTLRAVGMNYREGYTSSIPKVVPHSVIVPAGIVNLDYHDNRIMERSAFTVARNGDILMMSDSALQRFTDGTLTATYTVPVEDSAVIAGLGEDASGTVYCLEFDYGHHRHSIMKFSRNLEVVKRVTGVQPDHFGSQVHFSVSTGGTVHLASQSDTGDLSTIYCTTYDSSLALTDALFRDFHGSLTSIPAAILPDDTIAVLQYPEYWGYTSDYQVSLDIFDPAFNHLRSFTDFDLFNRYRCPYEKFSSTFDPDYCYGGPGSTIIGYLDHLTGDDDILRITLMIADADGKMLARKVMQPPFDWVAPQFDSTRNICFSERDTVTGQIRIHRYSTGRLFGAL